MKDPAKQAMEKFFLKSDDMDDDYVFLAPIRRDTVLEPLIDGVAAFDAMAKEIAQATKQVNLASWILNPQIPLIKGIKVNGNYVSRWADLFFEIAKKGVYVRLLISDFDPIIGNEYHQTAWAAYNVLMNHSKRLPSEQRHRLQPICSRHEATIGKKISTIGKNVLEPILKKQVRDLNNSKNLKAFMNSPGLWPLVEYNKKRKKPFTIREDVDYILYPASHHQKICTIDGEIAFLGGLDIQKSRIDDQKHRGYSTKSQLWHDIHCRLEGTIVRDIDRNFGSRWNREVQWFLGFIDQVNKFSPGFLIRRPPVGLYVPLEEERKRRNTIHIPAQLHRTLSEDAIFSIVPNNIRDDIAEGYEKAIESAESFIYIENQYLRSSELTEWIIDRYEDKPSLCVIIVIPVAPEEVTEDKVDPLTNHGIFLQNQVLTNLQKKLGENVGFFSMATKTRHKEKRGKKPVLTYNSLQIYVHSKLIIVDDVYCNIGSANTNPRSFAVDTEASVAWYAPKLIRNFRLKLWEELLGRQKGMAEWKPKRFLHYWNRIASANSNRSPEKRSGFIVPHDIKRYRGKQDEDIPEEFV